MHLEKNGNYVIDKVKFNKKSIYLISGEDKIKISATTYSHFYLYNDRVLSQEELNEIIAFDGKSKSKDYINNLLGKGNYSIKQVKEKLAKRKVPKKEIDEIVNDFVNLGYLNDDNFLEEKLEIMERKNYGKNKIIQALIQNGISKDKINLIEFDCEEDKALKQLEKYMLHHKEYNYNQMKQGGYNYLLSQGFEGEIALSVIEEKLHSYEVNEEELLEKVMSKYILLHHLDLNDAEHKQKVVSYLLRKGYQYESIANVMRRIK